MKKAIRVLVGMSCIVALSTSVNAQENSYALPASVSANSNANNAAPSAVPAGVSSAAFSHFTSKVTNATDVKWVNGNAQNSVHYKVNGVQMRNTYNLKGKLEYTIRYYIGKGIPAKVTNLIRKNGYYMTPLVCTEIVRNHITTQLVKMEDDYSYLTVQIHPDGEVTETESYRKQR